ncbi:MAG: molybdopterin-guanine dinucleotide biosynthesis protein B [Candidatus Hydrothermarchaeaceae archaeon]
MVLCMRVLAVIGTGRESGKTTTVESLIKEFIKRGYSVGAIKQIHEYDFSIDTPHKDTWRLTKAGAKVVVAAAPQEISLIKRVEKDRFQESFELLKVEGLDLVVVEGNPLRDVPKILATRDPEKAVEVISREDVICISSLTPERFAGKNLDLRVFHPIKEVVAMVDHTIKYLKK